MKKLIIGACACVLMIGLIIYYFAACVGPKSPWEDITKDVDYYNMSHDYAVVGKYIGNEKNIVIAHEYYNQDVTTIDTEAFSGTKVEYIKVPACVTTINTKAFYDCKNLKKIEFEEGSKLQYIGTDAFKNCIALESIELPAGLTTIQEGAFNGCYSLKEVEIPSGVSKLSKEAFANCLNLKTLTLSDKLTDIGADAIKNTKIFNTVSNWEDGALYVGNYLFDTDRKIEGEYKVKEGTLVVAGGSFVDSTELLSVELPESLITIGLEAFNGCKSLIEVYNKSDIDIKIGFKEDRNNSMATGNIGVYADNIYTDVANKKLEEQSGVWMYEGALVKYFGDLESVTVDSDVVAINSGTFLNNTKIKSITIPASVKKIGEDAFAGCKNLTTVNYLGTADQWAQITFANGDSNPLSYAKAKLFIGGTELKNATLSTATISENAFAGCSSLESVTFTTDVKTIGKNAFLNCNSLNKVNYLGTVDQWAGLDFATVGSNPLAIAHDLYINDVLQTEITLHAEVIAKLTFYGCYSINRVNFGSEVKTINNFAFTNCYYLVEACDLSTMNIQVGMKGAGDIGKYLLAVYKDTTTKLTNESNYLIFTDGETKTLVRYLDANTNTTITLPEVTKVKDYAFIGTKIEKVTISASITEIGAQAFEKCDKLNAVTFAANSKIEKIGTKAFADCSSLKSIIIPDTGDENKHISIGANAFTYYKDFYIYSYEKRMPSSWRGFISNSSNVKYEGKWEIVNGEPKPV